MRFWLKWAILTLPVAGCMALWIRSYCRADMLIREGYHHQFSVGSRYGSLEIVFMRDSDWHSKGAEWSYRRAEVGDRSDHLTQRRFLGFGLDSLPGPTLTLRATVIEVPIAFLALLPVVPPVWSYRNHRKRRKTGFPIEPTTAQGDDPKANTSSLR